MYLVKALAAAPGPLALGEKNVAWAANEVRLVAEDAIGWYRANSAVFTELAGPSDVACIVAADKQTATAAAGAVNGATVSAVETMGVVNKTVLTFTALPITMRDTEQGGGVKVYDFPAGRIAFLGAVGSIAVTTTSVLADTLNAGVTCNWGIGSTTQASATLATTEQNIIQVAAFTSSATINVAGAAAAGFGAATALASPVDAYLNLAVAGATDIDANATVTVTGTATIYWVNLG
jgi:hypothetical protein